MKAGDMVRTIAAGARTTGRVVESLENGNIVVLGLYGPCAGLMVECRAHAWRKIRQAR